MTYLETLIRTLPRQRRAFESQRNIGVGMFICGLIAAVVGALVDKPVEGLVLVAWILTASMLLFGGYRATRADILLAENAELQQAVSAALEEEYRRNVHTVTGVSSNDEFIGAVSRGIAERIRKNSR